MKSRVGIPTGKKPNWNVQFDGKRYLRPNGRLACNRRSRTTPTGFWICTRPKGHPGRHAAQDCDPVFVWD